MGALEETRTQSQEGVTGNSRLENNGNIFQFLAGTNFGRKEM
jgi:hypothetical protein